MLEIFGQLVLATVLGALVGLERNISKKEAGLRTFALVSLGSALFTVISVLASEKFSGPNFNVSQIPSQIVIGVGFIGAGLIIFHGSHLKGLTTAAGLWAASAIGMAVGFKFYFLSIFTTVLVVLIFVVLWLFENKITKKLANTLPEED